MLSVGMIITIAIGTLLLLGYILICCRKRNVLGLEVKSLVSVFYISTAAMAIMERPENCKYGLMIMIGGVMGLLGDVYLDQKWIHLNHKEKYLILGFLNFGIGHLFYITAVITNVGFEAKDFIIPAVAAIGVPVFNEILSKPLKQDFGKFRLIVFVYGGVLSFMMGTAISAYLKTGSTAYLIYAIGGVSFLVSDIVLSAIYFTPNDRKVTEGRFVINIVTYYIGKYLISITTFFIEA